MTRDCMKKASCQTKTTNHYRTGVRGNVALVLVYRPVLFQSQFNGSAATFIKSFAQHFISKFSLNNTQHPSIPSHNLNAWLSVGRVEWMLTCFN